MVALSFLEKGFRDPSNDDLEPNALAFTSKLRSFRGVLKLLAFVGRSFTPKCMQSSGTAVDGLAHDPLPDPTQTSDKQTQETQQKGKRGDS